MSPFKLTFRFASFALVFLTPAIIFADDLQFSGLPFSFINDPFSWQDGLGNPATPTSSSNLSIFSYQPGTVIYVSDPSNSFKHGAFTVNSLSISGEAPVTLTPFGDSNFDYNGLILGGSSSSVADVLFDQRQDLNLNTTLINRAWRISADRSAFQVLTTPRWQSLRVQGR